MEREKFSCLCEGGGDLCRRRYQADVHHQTTQHREKEFLNYATVPSQPRTEAQRGTTTEKRYRHLVNTCTSQAGPLRVKGKQPVPPHRSHSLSPFHSVPFSSTTDAYRYDSAEYTTRVHGHVQHAASSLFISFAARSFHLPSGNRGVPEVSFEPLSCRAAFPMIDAVESVTGLFTPRPGSNDPGHSRVLLRRNVENHRGI